MALEFKLPDIGEGIAEGEIVKWLVSAGDAVEEHQPVVEVMTDKATVEVPAPQAGTVTELRAKEGDVVPVGSVIFVLDSGGGGAKSASEPAQEDADASSSQESEPEPGPEPKKAEPKAEPKKAEPKKAEPKAEPKKAEPKAEPKSEPKREPARAQAGGGKTIAFKLPDIGEGIAEGEIVQWLVEEGASVEEHQPVVEVMTDKATVEIPAPAAGTVTAIKAKAGEVVPIGTVIFDLATGTGAESGAESAAEPQPEREEAAGAKAGSSSSRNGAGSSAGNGKVLAVPSARRVARELGVDLTRVKGSGRSGVIRRADVEAFLESAPTEEAPAPAADRPAPAPAQRAPIAIQPGERETRVPFRGIRRKIAEAMARSKYTATHFTVVEELDATELVAARTKAKAVGERQGVKITYMPFIMKATAAALARFPELNSQLDESTQEIVTYDYVNLGIATDTPQGLIVPVIRDVQAKGLLQLGAELQELAERTRSGKIKPDELSGGTFTITNAGNIGGILATPIINFPEVGILGVHRLMKRPGVVETPEGDTFEVRQYMNLSISVDHRLVDGASAARFLVYLKEMLETPALVAL